MLTTDTGELIKAGKIRNFLERIENNGVIELNKTKSEELNKIILKIKNAMDMEFENGTCIYG